MNNSTYLRALFGAFSCAQTDAMHLQEAEIAFRSPCFEGDTLSIRTRPVDGGLDVGMVRGDGTTAAAARLTFGNA
jgi:acyl-ACP thioesterase